MCYNNRMNMIKKTVIFSLLSVCSIFCPPAQAAVGIRGSDIAQHTITVNNLAFTPIISTDTLQAGTTFYVSSGTVGSGGLTVLGPLSVQGSSVSSGTILAGNLQLTGWAVAGSSITAGAGFYGDGSKLSGVITSTSALQADINSRVLKAGDTMTGSLSVIPSAIGVMIQVSTIIPTIDTTHAYYGLYSVNGSANNNTPSGTARKATGIYGEGFGIASESGPSAVSVGVSGKATGYGTNYGLYGYASNGAPNYAAYLDGDMLSTGTVSAVSFIGDGSRLTGVVKTTGDTMTGPLTQTSSITLHSPTNGVAFSVIRLQDNSIIPADISIGADSSRNYKVSGGAGEGMKWAPNNSPSHAMYLDSSGNLAIGNGTSPSYPLDVDGIVRATSYIGNGSTLTGVITSTSVLSSQISANTAALTTAAYLASTQTFTAAQTMTGPLTLAGSSLTITTGMLKSGTVLTDGSDTGRFIAAEEITAHAHYGFLDVSSMSFTTPDTYGHASFNSAVTINGSADVDHNVGFQESGQYQGTGRITGMKGFTSQSTIVYPGTATYTMGYAAYTPTGTGLIDATYGFYADGSNTRGTLNYAFYSQGSAPSYLGGKLGIGIQAPSAALHVHSSPDANYGNLALDDSRTTAADVGGVATFAGYKTGTSAKGIFAKIKGLKENATSANEAGYLAFETNNNAAYVEGMRITSGQKIGIGTANPSTKLHVSSGTLTVDGTGARITTTGNVTATSAAFTLNTATSTFAGYIDMGLELVANSCTAAASCTATCPAGKYIISGGCFNLNKPSRASYPNTTTTWYCGLVSPDTDTISSYAYCARVVAATGY